MAGHFLLSAQARDFTLKHVEKMSSKAVHDYFVHARWGASGLAGKPTCPDCGSIDKHYWIKTRSQWRCRSVGCAFMFSVTSGTAFADHKLPLKTILKAMMIFNANVKGTSAMALSRLICVAYQTAFVLLHKLRESITRGVNKEPLQGLVHMDGAHVSGKVRKPRKNLPTTKMQARTKYPADAFARHPNRRIVMAIREVFPEKGRGASRTIIGIVYSENRAAIERLAEKYVAEGATMHTDELAGYTKLSKLFRHQTVNHSKEFSTDDGVSNNQAESFFARVRRFIIGQVHRVTPHYMYEYMNEIAWREDTRKDRPSQQIAALASLVMRWPSRKWRGYWAGKDRPFKVRVDGYSDTSVFDPEAAELDFKG